MNDVLLWHRFGHKQKFTCCSCLSIQCPKSLYLPGWIHLKCHSGCVLTIKSCGYDIITLKVKHQFLWQESKIAFLLGITVLLCENRKYVKIVIKSIVKVIANYYTQFHFHFMYFCMWFNFNYNHWYRILLEYKYFIENLLRFL